MLKELQNAKKIRCTIRMSNEHNLASQMLCYQYAFQFYNYDLTYKLVLFYFLK